MPKSQQLSVALELTATTGKQA
jgi:hypothetical protein